MTRPFPADITVFERGWLSSNNILLRGERPVLVDSGYATHAAQTVALVEDALQDQPLSLLLNTHLHSDHCGGNAALQQRYPALQTEVPAGEASAVALWDQGALSYRATGQQCPRFTAQGTLSGETERQLGDRRWEVHAAPGHDPNSVMLFEPASRTLVSADALWEHGFGVVFPELIGEPSFAEVAATLDQIERLAPEWVVPGHGRVFPDVKTALATARRRLDGMVRDPVKHARHAFKVLIKFKLLEQQRMSGAQWTEWRGATPYFKAIQTRFFSTYDLASLSEELLKELIGSGAARREGDSLVNV
ncbi:MBL fold metallo-hydrolase [Variovorax sp. UMC13]|uniref:MBL fold metallo-hydrolase n=1 Tax=Variovorax sp. UMC13 TaxID=1862326 RepID=UPI001C8111C8